MIHAYHEVYLSRAQDKLGDAFDFAVNTCEIPGKDNWIPEISRIEQKEYFELAGKVLNPASSFCFYFFRQADVTE